MKQAKSISRGKDGTGSVPIWRKPFAGTVFALASVLCLVGAVFSMVETVPNTLVPVISSVFAGAGSGKAPYSLSAMDFIPLAPSVALLVMAMVFQILAKASRKTPRRRR